MQKIYSKIESGKLLHMVVRKEDLKPGRINLVDDNQFLQCAALNLKKNTTFKAHKHIWKKRTMDIIAQESWVVIKGSVRCFFYDLNNTILDTVELHQGDASFTLEGGHNYLILEDDTLVYEMKTGPYEGQGHDKKFI